MTILTLGVCVTKDNHNLLNDFGGAISKSWRKIKWSAEGKIGSEAQSEKNS